MKFIKLEILNLASLDREDGETINFEEGALGESNIFSIVGATGSGKSTILDAICLALYNRAPRYPRKKGERNQAIEIYGEPEEGEKNRLAPTDSRNILTRGKKHGYSKLTFLANNGDIYRAEWSVRFLQRKYGDAATALYKISQRGGETIEEAAEWDKLPQIIGLEYDQFLRTVLIAQGSFANFISAKENERYELLEKLIGCEELYAAIAQKIKENRDKAEEAYTQIDAQNSAYKKDLLDTKDLEALQKRIDELEEENKEVQDNLQKVTNDINWYTTEKEHTKKIGDYSEAYDQAKKAVEESKDTFDRLNLHDATLQAVGHYKEKSVAEKNVAQKQADLESLNTTITDASKKIEAESKELETLKKEEADAQEKIDEQKPHINNARTIKAELSVKAKDVEEKKGALQTAKTNKENADKEVETNTKKIKELDKKSQQAEQDYNALQEYVQKKKGELAEKVRTSTESYNKENDKLKGLNAAELQDAKSNADKKLTDLKDGISALREWKKKQDAFDKNKKEIDTKSERNIAIKEKLKTFDIEALSKELETLRKTHTLMSSENWAEHRHNLEEGKSCPLCGAIEHPYKSDEAFKPVISELARLIKKKDENLSTQRDEQTKLSKELTGNNSAIETLSKNNDSIFQDIQTHKDRWNTIHEIHTEWDENADTLEALIPAVEEEVSKAAQNLKQYSYLLNTVDQLRKKKEADEKEQSKYLEESQKEIDDANQKKNNASSDLQIEQGKTKNLVGQQTEKATALEEADNAFKNATQEYNSKKDLLKKEIGEKDPDAFEAELNKAKDDATKKREEKEKAIQEQKEKLEGNQGQVKVIEQDIKTEKGKASTAEQDLNVWIAGYNAKNEAQITVEIISELSSATDNWEDIRGKKQKKDQALTQAKTTLDNEVDAHTKHQEKKPQTSEEELLAKEQELKGWSTDELTNAKAIKQRHEEAQKQMGDMAGELENAERLKEEWDEINKAIGGEGKTLRKIAQCYTLRFLVEHANVEIRKFNSRYELQQVKNSLGIRVVDHDRADDVRDTTSLSGGETFIVSLGLALGLSALSSRNISFDNLFIDEGFGTLDPETLATVIDSLAMLQTSQGKKVGVISHTDTMSERITTQIRIIKNGNSGSSHIEVYP